nr:MAG TPA: hypothetical protein [Bacteriophage sp.]
MKQSLIRLFHQDKILFFEMFSLRNELEVFS